METVTEQVGLNLQRQSFLGAGSDAILRRTRIAIIGLGGGGSHITQQLAHVGLGEFVLLDPDRVEDTNLNRLIGATEKDVKEGTEKVVVAKRVISSVNSSAVVTARVVCWQECSDLLKNCDVVFSCLDTLIARDELDSFLRRYLVPLIDIGMDVHAIGGEFIIAGQVAVSVPDAPCLRCMGLLTESAMKAEAEQYGEAGPRPQVVWPNAILASTAVGCFMQMITPWQSSRPGSLLLEYDGNAQTVQPSAKLPHLPSRCIHYAGIANLGDPFWSPPEERTGGEGRV